MEHCTEDPTYGSHFRGCPHRPYVKNGVLASHEVHQKIAQNAPKIYPVFRTALSLHRENATLQEKTGDVQEADSQHFLRKKEG